MKDFKLPSIQEMSIKLREISFDRKIKCTQCGYTTTGNIHTHGRNCPKGGKCTFQYV